MRLDNLCVHLAFVLLAACGGGEEGEIRAATGSASPDRAEARVQSTRSDVVRPVMPKAPATRAETELEVAETSTGSTDSIDQRLQRDLGNIVRRWKQKANELSKGKTSGKVRVAVHVRELDPEDMTRGGRVLVSIEGRRAMRPASNMKLVTTAAALEGLGVDGVFRTRFLAGGPIEGGLLKGDLVVLGGGDPLYAEETGGAVEAWLEPLVSHLKSRGIDRVEGGIVLDEGDFQEPQAAPGWPDPKQYWTDYCALSGAFSANGGCFSIRVSAGASDGARARVVVEPRDHGLPPAVDVKTGAKGSKLNVAVEGHRGKLIVRGSLPRGTQDWPTSFSAGDPVRLFGEALRGALERGGIALGREEVLRTRGAAAKLEEEVAVLESPISWSLGPINTDSNNPVADQLFLALGHQLGGGGTREGGSKAVRDALTRLGVPTTGYAQADGSGLSRDNRVSAEQITALLHGTFERDLADGDLDGAWPALRESLAVGGESGTLRKRMKAPILRGKVHAKTGFIGGTSALSGVVTDSDGRELLFSILVEYPVLSGLNTNAWKPMQDAICERLAEVGGMTGEADPDSSLSREERLGALEIAERAAREAGELLLGSLGRLDGERIRSKSAARDLVTRLDVESERLIVPRLREAFPDHAIEAEEETRDEVGGEEPRWFVDPLDGTVNYVHGLPFFCVSIALYQGTTPLVAVVHAPRLGETFTAVRGEGAWLAGPRESLLELSCSKAAELGDAVLCTGFPYRRGELEHDNLANFGRLFHDVRGMRRLGSAALDLAYVAAGRLDAFWEMHLQPHDLAAGALLVREAGGRVQDFDGGQDWLRAGHVVAGPEPLVERIAERLEH